MEKTAHQIIEILQFENIVNAHFVGHSMGGYVSLEILNQEPNLVGSLTLLNSTAKEDSTQKKADRLLAVKVFDRSPSVFINAAIENLFYAPNLDAFPDEVKRMQSIALKTSIEGAKGSLRGMRERNDFVSLIGETEVPIHIVAGRFDNTVLYSTILEQVIGTNVLLTTLETGHLSFIESFDECKDAMINFIENYP
jgi:pimeloyl-ACP methyl ester carboxylesterase